MNPKQYEVIIIGGASSGLSAALVLGRCLRRVLVIDNGQPSNRFAEHSHNFLTHDGHEPAHISAQARAQVEAYDTVEFVSDTALSAVKTETGFTVNTEMGATYEAQRIILATGVEFQSPNIKGFAACWGVSALHCPYCHGYEFKDQPTGVLFEQPFSSHYLGLIHHLSADVRLFTNGANSIKAERLPRLQALNIPMITEAIVEIHHTRGYMTAIELTSGERVECHALYAPCPAHYRHQLALDLGCETDESGYIKRDNHHQTNVKGIYACGDVSGAARSIAVAVAAGNLTGVAVHESLLTEKFI